MKKDTLHSTTCFWKIKICLLVLTFLSPVYLVAQLYPALTDFGSLTGSVTANSQYIAIKKVETALTKEVNGFRNEYSKRLQYITFTSLIASKIDSELLLVINRHKSLVTKNNALSFLYSSTRKQNVKKLKIIELLLNRTKNDINLQYRYGSINGEKLNLYLNLMASLHEINALMDNVEESINKSTLLNAILAK